MTPPSRGSALYAATLATIGAAAAVRFFTTSADALPVRAVGVPTASPTAVAPSSSPSESPTGTALSWGRGAHPTPVPTPVPTSSPTTATSVPAPRPTPTPTRTSAPAPVVKPAAPVPAAPAPAPAPAPVTKVVVGSTVQTPYGPVQVSVTFTGATITAAQALQAPSGGYSSQVSAYALPVLSSEAVAASSANIATVSGASFTSAGYRQSLQYAIDHRA